MQADFADDSIDGGTAARLASLCSETDPRKGATQMKTEVVRAGAHRVTEAMREWALLSWYEARRVRDHRRRLLSRRERRSSSRPSASANPLDGALDATGAATSLGRRRRGARSTLFRKAVSCVNVSGAANNFTYPSMSGGEETAFKKTLARVAKHH